MALSVYDAVISSYEYSGGSLADAWAIAEQQGQEDREKTNSNFMLHSWLTMKHPM